MSGLIRTKEVDLVALINSLHKISVSCDAKPFMADTSVRSSPLGPCQHFQDAQIPSFVFVGVYQTVGQPSALLALLQKSMTVIPLFDSHLLLRF